MDRQKYVQKTRPGLALRSTDLSRASCLRLVIGALVVANIASAWVATSQKSWILSATRISSESRQSRIQSILHFSQQQENNDISHNHEVGAINKHWMETIFQVGRTAAATATLAGVLLLSPDSLMSNPQHGFLMPPSSYAESILEQVQTPTKEQATVLDEVWTLIDKYYIDRTFNGQVSLFKYA